MVPLSVHFVIIFMLRSFLTRSELDMLLFSLAFIPYIDQCADTRSFSIGDQIYFEEAYKHDGFWPFVLHSELLNPFKGYLVKDTVILETEITTEAINHVQNECDTVENYQPVPAATADFPQKLSNVLRAVLASVARVTESDPVYGSAIANLQCLLRSLVAAYILLSGTGYSIPVGAFSFLRISHVAPQHREKLSGFLNMSLEEIHKSNLFNDVAVSARIVADLTTDFVDAATLYNLASEFRKSTNPCSSMIEESRKVESSRIQIKNMEARLADRENLLTCLEAEIARLGEEETELESEIQRLLASKAKVVDHKSSTAAEIAKVKLEASRELEESSRIQIKNMEARSAHRENRLTFLDDEISRLGEEETKLETEIQRQLAWKAKVVDYKSSTTAEMEKVKLEACRESEELKEQLRENKRASDTVAQANSWWEILKVKLESSLMR
ncbi:hypothetical protein LINGRAHAP2_LOCUS35970 [Linum grandiflorum]